MCCWQVTAGYPPAGHACGQPHQPSSHPPAARSIDRDDLFIHLFMADRASAATTGRGLPVTASFKTAAPRRRRRGCTRLQWEQRSRVRSEVGPLTLWPDGPPRCSSRRGNSVTSLVHRAVRPSAPSPLGEAHLGHCGSTIAGAVPTRAQRVSLDAEGTQPATASSQCGNLLLAGAWRL